ncbi:MAG: DNA methyltransferase [Myxococcota bacterium]|nr:DNA methyltransferase [Myxococcota bacterium]
MSKRKPPLEPQLTTLWDYPSQHYGQGTQGSARYRGATPSYVIWNLLSRYTRQGDVVVDPMCGSGTTLDVAADLGRTAYGFDLQPQRKEIQLADARQIPLEDDSADFVFIDPPYSTNLKYSDDPRCIGKLSAAGSDYFEALADVYEEAYRILKNRRYIAIYICDVWNKKDGFLPIGASTMMQLSQYFRLVDHVSVVRHNKNLKMNNHRKAAQDGNFFLRGFNHLIIGKKHED